MTDIYDTYQSTLESPPSHCDNVTPNDSADLDYTTTYITVGTPGDVKVTMKGGETKTIPQSFVERQPIIPGRFKRIWDTGTTATDIMSWW